MPLGTYLETEDIRPQVEIIVIIILHQKDYQIDTTKQQGYFKTKITEENSKCIYYYLFMYD